MVRRRLRFVLFAALFLPLAWGVLPAEAKDLSKSDVAILAQALAMLDANKSNDARKLAKQAKDPLVGELVLFFDLVRSDQPATFAEVAAFLDRHPTWPRRETLALKAENLFPASLDAATTAAWFDRYPPKTGKGAFLYVDALAALGRTKEAKVQALALWRTLPLPEAQEKAFLERYGSWLGKDDEVARLMMLLEMKQGSAATRQAKRAGGGYVELAAARVALQDGKSKADTLVSKVPSKLRGDGGLIVDLANWYYKRDSYTKLTALLNELGPQNAGRADDLWRLRLALARSLARKGDYKGAYRLAADNGLSEGTGFAELEWLAGYVALRQLKAPKDALAHFARYYTGATTSISKGKAAFWAALAEEARKKPDEARKWLVLAAEHDTAFYGQLAAARLGQIPGANLPAMPAIDAAAYKALAEGELGRAVKGLAGTGDRVRTFLFFDSMLKGRKDKAHYLVMGKLAQEVARWDMVVDVGKAARRDGLILIDYLFPVPPLAAEAYPEPALVLALIRQESEFDQAAISRAGARGLMQLMPDTAKGVAKKLGLGYSEAKLTSDPDYNVQLGTTYLAGLLDRYDGSYILSLAAYNAGPSRATAWIEQNGDPRRKGTDPVEWIESIPFEETRTYVMRIAEGVVVYRHLLGQAEVADWQGYNPASTGPDGARLSACCGN